MEIKRKNTKIVKLGKVRIGGDNPIVVQSMIKNRLESTEAVKNEIINLQECGCEVIRVAVPEHGSLKYVKSIMDSGVFKVPVVADIQFDHSIAIDSIKAGIDCIRINPGNIGSEEKIIKIVQAAKRHGSAIRIGVNSGSINKIYLKNAGGNIIEAMASSALDIVRLFESNKFFNFKISAKASSVMDTISVYRILSSKIDYPLHLGVTEAGPMFSGAIKSSVGIGVLLYMGIGDTIRVSLTERSTAEVKAAYTILSSLGLRKYGVDLISCPTCSRTVTDLKTAVKEIEELTYNVANNIKIAVMGCVVNGPGEAKDADIGIAYGKSKAAIFIKGKIIKRVDIDLALEEFKKELNRIII
jgi:(E)-4-hydroxy-3-methylbut-2-enyl-diphosphate synthase